MRKHFTSLLKMMAVGAMMLLSAAPAMGAETTVYLRTKSALDRAVVLGEMSQMVFGDQNVTVSLTNGNDIVIPVTDFTSLRLNNEGTQGGASGVVDLVADETEGAWQVFDLNGRYLGDSTVLEGQSAPGVYVVKSATKTFKLVVK